MTKLKKRETENIDRKNERGRYRKKDRYGEREREKIKQNL